MQAVTTIIEATAPGDEQQICKDLRADEVAPVPAYYEGTNGFLELYIKVDSAI